VTVGPPPFDALYRTELPRLVVLAHGLCPPSVAGDVAQEAMLVAYRKWRTVSALDRPDLWVRRVCANLAVSSFRRKVVEVRAVARLAARRELEPLSDDTEEVWVAVRSWPRRQAQAAALRFVYDLPVADIASVLGCSEGSVKQHLSRARASLRASLHLGEEGDLAWSPDGHQIAFLLRTGAGTVRLTTVTPSSHPLLEVVEVIGRCDCYRSAPALAWSSDGTRIAVSKPSNSSSGGPVWSVRRDGTGWRQDVAGAFGNRLAWQPVVSRP
jgi:RNA polymerase sigma-70 factor (ECF subfamily)